MVEDDAATREGLVRILHGAGLHAQAAEGGLQALALLRQSRPGLILLDLMMPGMDGFQLMETLQGSVELRTIPVVVLTAMELTPEVRARLRMSQIHRIIGKGTYSRDELVDVIRRYALRNLGDSGEGGA
ncbi:MAG TPA: response regulator [Holophaga sp.]|nr:response regulator [Holophaga sp.]